MPAPRSEQRNTLLGGNDDDDDDDTTHVQVVSYNVITDVG